MAVVDEKGRLFGKINLLDLVIVLAVLAVVGRFGYKAYQGKRAAPAGQDKTVQVTFLIPAVKQASIQVLPVGTKVYDSKSNAYLGKIVAVKAQPAVITGTAGEFESKTRFDYSITVEGSGRVVPDAGVSLGGFEMKVGRDNQLKTESWAGNGTTLEINPNPPQQ